MKNGKMEKKSAIRNLSPARNVQDMNMFYGTVYKRKRKKRGGKAKKEQKKLVKIFL